MTKGWLSRLWFASEAASIAEHNKAKTNQGLIEQKKREDQALINTVFAFSLSKVLKTVGVISEMALLKGFESGGTKLVCSEMLVKYPSSPTIGAPAETFIAPTSDINKLLSSGKSRVEIAKVLGIEDPAFLKGELIRVDLTPQALKELNLRVPSGNEAGANGQFIPGGKISGGITEGVVNGIPKSYRGVSQEVVKE